MPKLYIGDVSIFENCDIYDNAYANASAQRKEKIKRFRFDKDKKLSLLADCLLKKATKQLNIQSDIIYNKTGKPAFKENINTYLSIAHSGQKAVIALSKYPIGCDIEENSTAYTKIAKHFFSLAEQDYIFNGNIIDDKLSVNQRFFKVWTLKESFVKMTGKGISQLIHDTEVLIYPQLGIKLNGRTQEITAKEFILDNYSIAVCYDSVTVEPLQIFYITREDL